MSIIDRLLEEKLTKRAEDTAGLDKAAADAMALDILDDVMQETDKWAAEQIDALISKL